MIEGSTTSNLLDDPRAQSIYRTAAQIIYTKGFDATSMNEIADAVQLTKPGLYYYVKGKKELLYTIMTLALNLLEEKVIRVARAIADPEERLRTIIREHARLLTHEAGTLAILIDEVAGLNEVQREEVVRRKRAYFDLLRGTLDQLVAEDRLRPLDTTVTAFSLLGMVMWIARWYKTGGRLESDDVVAQLDLILTGVMLRPEAAAKEPVCLPI